MLQLLVTDIDGNRQYLDMNQEQPIAVNKSFLELSDFTKRKGDFSRTFNLPRTEANDSFFGQFGNPSNIGGIWNPLFVSECWLMWNGGVIIEGALQLVSADADHDRYVVSVAGVIFSLKDAIADKSMSDLDMISWSYTAQNIPNTWGRGLFSGHVVFPIHDFGFGYGLYKKDKAGSANVLIDITDATCANTCLTDRTLPAFRLNELLRMIFNEAGFDVSGSWFSETSVEDIYVQSDNPLSNFFAVSASTFNAAIGPSLSISSVYQTIPFQASPAIGDFNNTLFRYTAPINASYNFGWLINPQPGSPSSVLVQYQILKNGTTAVYTSTGFAWTGAHGVPSYNMTLNAGDYIEFQIRDLGGATTAGRMLAGGTTYWSLNSLVPAVAAIDPSEHLANYKQIDFLRELVSIFNLIVWRDSDTSYRLDTWDYYMANFGTKKDWTDKVLKDRKIITKPINQELADPINIELKRAADILNEEYVRVTGRSYGSYREDNMIPFSKGPAEPYKVFAPAPLQEVTSAVPGAVNNEIVIGKYYASEDDLSYKPPGLQLMYYCGLRTLSTTFYYLRYAGDTCQAGTSVPVFSPFLLTSAGSWNVLATTLDLNFTWFTPPSNNVTAATPYGIYNRYWAEMLRERYAEGNKIVEFEALLLPGDFGAFNFADTIMINIDGTPVGLKILEIRDYVPNLDRPCKIKAMISFLK